MQGVIDIAVEGARLIRSLTEELLREIYRIPLTVADIPVPGGSVKGCVYDA